MPANQTNDQVSNDDWTSHVATWRASGLTRIEYCQRHDLKLNTFVYQINRRQAPRSKALTLVPVKVGASVAGAGLILHGPKGWSLALAPDVSSAWLGELLGCLS